MRNVVLNHIRSIYWLL